MVGLFSSLFDTSDFPARWHCGQWTAAHGWLHIGADVAIFGAYAAIPVVIAYFVRQRRDLHFTSLYWLFGAFILACGFGHLLEAMIFWVPMYRVAGGMKLLTAAASWATVVALVRVLPEATTLPGAAKLNDDLRKEIADRRCAEQEVLRLNAILRDRVHELETLLDVLPVGIGIATDREGTSIRTNQASAALLKLSRTANASLSAPEGEAPTHFRVLVDGVELQPHQLPLQRSAREGTVIRDLEEEIVFDDGERRILLASSAPLLGHDGQPRGSVGAFVDVTALRRAQDERQRVETRLQETQKLESLGVLAGGIAHDFNNLLTGMMGNVSLARTELAPSSPIHGYLDQIDRASSRAADLCRQMLAYAGKGRFVVQRIDLSDLIRETTWLLQSTIHKSTLVRYELIRDLPPVLADATQLRQIVMNLVLNASEALAGSSGTVTVATGVVRVDQSYLETTVTPADILPGDFVFVEVSDTGAGMTPDVLAHIFDPFFTTKFTGRGLGLAAVLGIVRGHGGTLKVYSEPGRGTVFKVLLPVAGGVVDTAPAPVDRPIHWRGSGTILVVDDEETVRQTAGRLLRSLGFEVLLASHGEEGLELFAARREHVAAVLLDLTMPRMDGEQTFLALRRLAPDVKVLLMSGFNEQEAVHRFVGKGLAGFVQKPFRLEDLRDAVRKLLDL